TNWSRKAGFRPICGWCERSRNMHLTHEQLTAWEQDGFLVIEELFPEAEILRMIDEVESVLAEVREEELARKAAGQRLDSGVYVGLSVKRDLFRQVARETRLLDALEGLIGPEIGFLSD